jgi:four helix bundle protein
MIGRFQGGDLPERTFRFTEMILDLVDQYPNNTKGWVLSKQLIKSGTSIGANVHEAAQAFTEADFLYKCSIARKEASETHYWLRLSISRRLLRGVEAEAAIQEADELTRILSAIVQSLQHRLSPQPASPHDAIPF